MTSDTSLYSLFYVESKNVKIYRVIYLKNHNFVLFWFFGTSCIFLILKCGTCVPLQLLYLHFFTVAALAKFSSGAKYKSGAYGRSQSQYTTNDDQKKVTRPCIHKILVDFGAPTMTAHGAGHRSHRPRAAPASVLFAFLVFD